MAATSGAAHPDRSADRAFGRLAGSRALAFGLILLVVWAVASKAFLFRGNEYTASDLYSFLEMSRSWLLGAPLLYENAYGRHATIHGFYLMLAFAPLTHALGAYGLFAGLGLLEALAVWRTARTPLLDGRGRLAVLSGLLSPLAWYVFDDPGYGFHPELCYPPLAVLLALALAERRPVASLGAGLALALVKEDGALVLAAVLGAHYGSRLWSTRAEPGPARRRLWREATWSLGAAVAAFALGMLLLWWLGRGAPPAQEVAAQRVGRALGILWRTLTEVEPGGRRAVLLELLMGYAALVLLLVLPLGRRLGLGSTLSAFAAAPVLLTLVISDAQYKFRTMLWAPRAATLMAVAVGCLLAVASLPGETRSQRRGPLSTAALVLLSWAGQAALLVSVGHTPFARLGAAAPWAVHPRLSGLPADQVRLWRCLAAGMPRGTPVSPPGELYPFFHRQSIVFQTREAYAHRLARLRIDRTTHTGPSPLATEPCASLVAAPYRILATCELEPLLRRCR